jgi:hypothetical protein
MVSGTVSRYGITFSRCMITTTWKAELTCSLFVSSSSSSLISTLEQQAPHEGVRKFSDMNTVLVTMHQHHGL